MNEKKEILFSIGSYDAKNQPKISKISTNGLFSSPDEPILRNRPNSLDVSTSAYNTLPRGHKFFNSRYSNSITNDDDNKSIRPQSMISERRKSELVTDRVEKPMCPPNLRNGSVKKFNQNGIDLISKPIHPPTFYNRSVSLEPEQLRHSGKVALTIAAYEGAPRTPTRLHFLPPSRPSSRASSVASTPVTPAPTPVDETDASDDFQPISTRLHNELSDTLKRSDLKNRSESVITENGDSDAQSEVLDSSEASKLEAEIIDEKPKNSSEELDQETEVMNGNVKKLALVLDKMMVFRAQIENNEEHEKNV
ncbi:hypothetical protein QAD02_006492 [Eretmocerus hayati]|uniref:Uncharacterized protein n=1 Tax=Eretmocerus hayati TaxID=131215 RepID=A0ACC2N5C3_9HYME|nr:hypothetical protein QAD02_006492 [Eretmocerus hayati]